jgi:hypothetical protein
MKMKMAAVDTENQLLNREYGRLCRLMSGPNHSAKAAAAAAADGGMLISKSKSMANLKGMRRAVEGGSDRGGVGKLGRMQARQGSSRSVGSRDDVDETRRQLSASMDVLPVRALSASVDSAQSVGSSQPETSPSSSPSGRSNFARKAMKFFRGVSRAANDAPAKEGAGGSGGAVPREDGSEAY